jgi:hypothetical protein
MMHLFPDPEPSFRWGIVSCKLQGPIFSQVFSSHALYFRNMKDFGSIPFAARGTVIGFDSENQQLVDVLFDEPFASGTNLGGRCSIMRGASVSIKYLLNVTTVCAPAISNASVKLEKPASMSASHFAAAHDSVILATDVPVVTKSSQGKLNPKPLVQPVQQTSTSAVASSHSNTSSLSPRVMLIAPSAPPDSVTANIPFVKSSVSGSKQAALSIPSSDLMAILNSGKKKSVATPGPAGNVVAASSKSTVNDAKASAGVQPAAFNAPPRDLLAILKSDAKKPNSIPSVAPGTTHLASSVSAPDQSARATVGPAQSPFLQFSQFPPPQPPQLPMNYGMMMGMHPMFVGMMHPMPPQSGSSVASVPVAPSASRPDASAKVHTWCIFFLHYFSFELQGLARLLERAGITAPPK